MEVRNPKMDLRVWKPSWTELCSFWRLQGRIHFFAFSSFQRRLYSWNFLHLQSPQRSPSNLSDFCLRQQSPPLLGLPGHMSFTGHLWRRIIWLGTDIYTWCQITHPRTYSPEHLKDLTGWDTYPQTSPSSDRCVWAAVCCYFVLSDNNRSVPLILGLLWLQWAHLENLRTPSHHEMVYLITASKYLLTCKVMSSQVPRIGTWASLRRP